jgi:hypothetical protein
MCLKDIYAKLHIKTRSSLIQNDLKQDFALEYAIKMVHKGL